MLIVAKCLRKVMLQNSDHIFIYIKLVLLELGMKTYWLLTTYYIIISYIGHLECSSSTISVLQYNIIYAFLMV